MEEYFKAKKKQLKNMAHNKNENKKQAHTQ